MYEEPVTLAAGTTVHAGITYDNADDNPRNPTHLPKRVFWGLGIGGRDGVSNLYGDDGGRRGRGVFSAGLPRIVREAPHAG